MAMTEPYRNGLLNFLFRKETYTVPTTYYLAISTTDTSTLVTEPTAGSYTRLPIENNTINWTTATAGEISNAVVFRFQEAITAWNDPSTPIQYWAIYNAQTSGDVIFNGRLSLARNVIATATLEIPVGGIKITLSNVN
jgi:hypothetical protein